MLRLVNKGLLVTTSSTSAEQIIFIGRSRAIHELMTILPRIAQSPAPVLIEGETGTGKEVFSRLVHLQSGRSGPLVSVNLSAIPATLVESELFGHERGAFTGAVGRRIGRFEQAQDGTLLLDEIGELPLDLQVKLLRVLEEDEVARLGSAQAVKINARMVAATNRSLQLEVGRKAFREDLYYRLAVLRVRIPPLRERDDDVLILADYFAGRERGPGNYSFREHDLDLLRKYPWPGNVRELRNIIQCACVLASGPVLDVAKAMEEAARSRESRPSATTPARTRLDADEIVRCARQTDGNIELCSKILGVNRWKLERAARRHGIALAEFRPGRSAREETKNTSQSRGIVSGILCTQETRSSAGQISQPPGAPYNAAWYVHRPEPERAALSYLSSPGTPVVIWGPRRYGKTFFSQHLLNTIRSQQSEWRIIELDLQTFSAETRGVMETLMREMAARILEKLGHPMEWLEIAWTRPSDCKGRLSWLMEQRILPASTSPVVLSIESADCLIGQPYQSDFFALLRAWAEAGGKRAWSQLRMMLMISTTPSVLVSDYHHSPFNLTIPIKLDDLTMAQAEELVRIYRLPWEQHDLVLLMSWVGGHPFLLRLAMHHAVQFGLSVAEIVSPHSPHSQIYDDHLEECRRWLSKRPEHKKAFSQLAGGLNKTIEQKLFHDLHRAGLVRQHDASSCELRCKLYEMLG